MTEYTFHKVNEEDKVWWVTSPIGFGEMLFSFDKKTVYALFGDYPYKLTPEQKEIFDKENPYWKNFFDEDFEEEE